DWTFSHWRSAKPLPPTTRLPRRTPFGQVLRPQPELSLWARSRDPTPDQSMALLPTDCWRPALTSRHILRPCDLHSAPTVRPWSRLESAATLGCLHLPRKRGE